MEKKCTLTKKRQQIVGWGQKSQMVEGVDIITKVGRKQRQPYGEGRA